MLTITQIIINYGVTNINLIHNNKFVSGTTIVFFIKKTEGEVAIVA